MRPHEPVLELTAECGNLAVRPMELQSQMRPLCHRTFKLMR